MITVTAYDANQAFCQNITSIEELKSILSSGRTVWVQVTEPETPEKIKQIADTFNIHELALEDVLSNHQRPKVEQYGDLFFIIAHELSTGEDIESKQLCFFLGKNYVVSFQAAMLESLKTC